MKKNVLFLVYLSVFVGECWTAERCLFFRRSQCSGCALGVKAKKIGLASNLDEGSPKTKKDTAVITDGKEKATTNVITQKKKKKEVAHWWNATDAVSFEVKDGKFSSLHLKIRGNPRSLVRHRTARGHMYNPSQSSQNSFRETVFEIFANQGDFSVPFFKENDALSITIVFRMKRAKSHFLGGISGPGRLKESAPKATHPVRSDIDNLVKFVLDTMNTVLYPDDRQISSLHVVRLLDNQEPYSGSTEIYLRAIQEEDLETILANSVKISQS